MIYIGDVRRRRIEGYQNNSKVQTLTLNRFARKSTHLNRSEFGTATWEEFDAGLRVNHSENEHDYTDDVFDSFKILDWDRETDRFGDELGKYSEVKMSSTSPICQIQWQSR